MKQNALAMHTYADANKSLPSATNFRKQGSTDGNATANYRSWTVLLMPFIEMSTTYDQLNTSENQLSGTGGANSNWATLAPNVRGAPIYTAQFCPSNPKSFTGETNAGTYLGGWGINNNRRSGGRCYDISLGPSAFPSKPPDCASQNSYCSRSGNWWGAGGTLKVSSEKATPGIFNWSFEFPCEFKDIPDGLTNTCLLLERRPELSQWSALYRPDSCGVTTAIRPNSSLINETAAAVTSNGSRGTNSGASSLHVGGVFATSTADAAVHFLSDTVDFEVFNYLGNRTDGSPLGKLP
jgi:hypothetical protein